MFKLGDKVKAKEAKERNDGFNHPAITGTITVIGLINYNDLQSELYYTVRNHGIGIQYSCRVEELSKVKVQILHAYIDSTDEVHWSSRQYSTREQEEFDFSEAKEYNKTIELE